MSSYTLHEGDSREVLKQYPADHFDAIITDPPYGLSKQPDMVEVLQHWLSGDDYKATGSGFMGKSWDSFVPGPATWREVYRVLKPGGHIVAFAGSRTYDLMSIAIRLAGFELRDQLMWIYGSGFPKSLNVSKALDRMVGAERVVVGVEILTNDIRGNASNGMGISGINKNKTSLTRNITAPTTDLAIKFDGYGSALKPAHEPIVLARKPITQSIAANVAEHGTGGLNIGGCRVGDDEVTINRFTNGAKPWGDAVGCDFDTVTQSGRYPANILHDGSTDVLNRLPVDAGGSVARFFYCGKASVIDREQGLQELPTGILQRVAGDKGLALEKRWEPKQRKNIHPTVKPTEVMRWLVRLISPPEALILDPFAGSGSTGKAAILEGHNFVGVDLDAKHCEIARARCQWAIDYRTSAKPETKNEKQGSLFND